MQDNNSISMKNLLASLACVAMLATVAIPSLTQLKQQSETVICANHLKGCVDGFNLYASVNSGKLMAMWDMSHWNNVVGYSPAGQVPYTMWYYIKGSVPPSTAWTRNGGWWNPYSNQYGGFSMLSASNVRQESNPTYHCPTVGPQMGRQYITPFSGNILSYSLPFTYLYDEYRGSYQPDMDYYLELDKFTHASTTVSMHELSTESEFSVHYNAWDNPGMCTRSNPHMGKSNFSFYDGHVELLTEDEFGQTLGYSYYPYMPKEDVEAAMVSE